MTFDVYVWKSPRDLDADRVEALIKSWHETGGDPGTSPVEPSTDVGWFQRELMKDVPGLDATSDAVPNASTAPIWLATTTEAPARMVAIRLTPSSDVVLDELDVIFGLAAKYDLVVFDTQNRRLHIPLDELAAHASATFWPAGAIRAFVAGVIGGAIAVAAWIVGIPLLSGVLALVGGFMFVMAVYAFIHEGRAAARERRGGGESSPHG